MSDIKTLNGHNLVDAAATAKLNSVIETVGGDTLTWDGDTTGLIQMPLEVGFAFPMYRISDVTPAIEELQTGCSGTISNGEGGSYTADNIFNMVDGYLYCLGFYATSSYVAVCLQDFSAEGVELSKGTYFAFFEDISEYFSSLTIPGYTGFTTEKIKQDALPEALRVGDVVTEIMSETEVTATDGQVILDVSLFSGNEEALFATFDGVEYKCDPRGVVDGLTLYGNMGLLGEADTGEPLLIGVGVQVGTAIMIIPDAEPHAVSIRGVVINKLDTKYVKTQAVFYVNSDTGGYLYRDVAFTTIATKAEIADAVNSGKMIVLMLANSGTTSVTIYPYRVAHNVDVYAIVLAVTTQGDEMIQATYHTAEYTGT